LLPLALKNKNSNIAKINVLAIIGSLVVEYSPHYQKVKGSCLALLVTLESKNSKIVKQKVCPTATAQW
jgi:hypothetical protein